MYERTLFDPDADVFIRPYLDSATPDPDDQQTANSLSPGPRLSFSLSPIQIRLRSPEFQSPSRASSDSSLTNHIDKAIDREVMEAEEVDLLVQAEVGKTSSSALGHH
jgi:hypothetical protein